MTRHRLLCSSALAAIALAASSAARAQVEEVPSTGDAAPRPGVESFRGSFHQAIRIEVPPFHGLEPDLALIYDSAAGNGWLGVGWGLAGSSEILRASPGRGAPRYAAGDIFLLDGVELVPDTGLGGTHREKFDRFRRIARDAATDGWTVTEKNGVRAAYTAIERTAGGTFRWALRSVTDRHGNQVTYDQSCGAAGCYLDRISYNGTAVAFVRQPRPDRITYATGASVAGMSERLARIEVRVGGSLARLYALGYAASAATGRSILTRVRQFGRDAVVSADGSVAGTSLPGYDLGYAEAGSTLAASSVWLTQTGAWRNDQAHYADVDGDGRLDAIHRKTDNTISVALSTGAGFAPPILWQSGLGGTYLSDQASFRDVDGDGRADLLFRKSNNTVWVGKSTGASFAPATTWSSQGGTFAAGQAQYGDVDGDGRVDLLFRSGSSFRVSRSTGSGFAPYAVWATIADTGAAAADQTRLVDLDGDGRADLTYRKSSDNTVWVARSSGEGFAPPAQWMALPGNYRAGQVQFGDFNGDGAADLAFRPVDCTSRVKTCFSCGNSCGPCNCAADEALVGQTACTYANQSCGGGDNAEAKMVRTSTCKRCISTGEVQIALSTGAGFEALATWSTEAPTSYKPGQARFADLNGDGRADLALQNESQEFRVALSTGTGFAAAVLLATHTGSFNNDQAQYGDVDGDGRDDLLFRDSDQAYRVSLALPADEPVDALVRLDNPMGGRVAVAYRPSSAWTNLNNPPLVYTAASVTVSDGRGTSSTTSFTYEGGKWLAPERRFLGFRRVFQALDAAGTVRETVFHQHARCQNQPEASWLRDAEGHIYSYESYVYDETAAAPYRSLVTERWHMECERGATCRRRLTQLGYDVFGDVELVLEHGDYDASGDESTVELGYVANQSAYIVARPAYENVYTGLGIAPDRLRARTQHVHDGAADYTAMPSVGDETRTRAWDSTTGQYVATGRSFDPAGNLTGETGPMGATATTTWDATYRLFPTARCNALGHCASTQWDPVLGRAVRETDANGQVTARELDPLGRLVRITYPNGGTTATSYVGFGQPELQHVETVRSDGTADGLWSRTYLDGLGRAYLETREGGFSRRTIHAADVPARIWKQSAWYGASESPRDDTFSFDGAGRVVRVLHADGTETSTAYGIGSATRRDEAGHERTNLTDGLGRVVAVREKLGSSQQETAYVHDVLDHLVGIVDAAGHETAAVHDSLGRMRRGCDPDRGCSTYSYNAAGSLLSRTDARGQTVAWTYDLLERPLGKTGGHTWKYDEAAHGASKGRVTTRQFPHGQDSLTYDFAGRVTSEKLCRDGTCLTFGMSYDATAEGRLRTVAYPDETVTYGYDATGALASVSGYATALVHDARGSLVSAALANGTTEAYSYDADRGRLVHAQVTKGTATLYRADYGHDADGVIDALAIQQPGASGGLAQSDLAFEHDELHRLTEVSGAQVQSFQYDALGNIVASSRVGDYEYADPAHVHAVTGVVGTGAATYSYDQSGNLLSGGGRTYTWDAEGRLARIVQGGKTTDMAYDPDGERVLKTGPSGATQSFGRLAEREGGAVTRYVFADGRRIARRTGTGAKHFFHQDHLGSVRLVTDGAGAVVRRYDYRPLGEVAATQGSLANPVRFTDHLTDDETGLVYMNARYYDPVLGRFVSADSVVPGSLDPQALNRYSYVLNSPVCYRDPTGHSPENGPTAGVHNDGGYGQHGYTGSSAGNPANRGSGGGNGGGGAGGRGGWPDMSKFRGDFSPGTMVFSYEGVRIVRADTSISLSSVIAAGGLIDRGLQKHPGAIEAANLAKGNMASITILHDEDWSTNPNTRPFPRDAAEYYVDERAAFVPEEALLGQPITRFGNSVSGDWVIDHEILGHLVVESVPGYKDIVKTEYNRTRAASDFVTERADYNAYENFAEETAGHFTGDPRLSPAARDVMRDFWGDP